LSAEVEQVRHSVLQMVQVIFEVSGKVEPEQRGEQIVVPGTRKWSVPPALVLHFVQEVFPVSKH